jgi:hypothetical protein
LPEKPEPDPIEEVSLDCVPNAVEVQAPHSSLPTSRNGRSTRWGPTHNTHHVLDIQIQASHLHSLFHWVQKLPLEQEILGQVLLLWSRHMEVQVHNHQCEAGKLTRFIEILPIQVKPFVKDVGEDPGGT